MSSIKKAGVVGFPVSHSLSPRLHNYWLDKYKIVGEYKAYEVKPENLAEFIENLRKDKDFVGVNLTVPYKEAVIPLLDDYDASVMVVGAVNTIIAQNRKLLGRNTDTYGFIENISSFVIPAQAGISLTSGAKLEGDPRLRGNDKKKAVVLGAGGAAKAVIFALQQLGFEKIIITNRTKERAEKLIANLPPLLDGKKIIDDKNVRAVDWKNRSEILQDADLLVNTTSLGMTGKESLEINLSRLPTTALVTDIVYSPLITPLLAQAQARGNPIIDGLGMLLYQAVPAFEAWFGVRPEVTEELRQYVLSGK